MPEEYTPKDFQKDLHALKCQAQALLLALDALRLRVPAGWCGTEAGLENATLAIAKGTKGLVEESAILDRDPDLRRHAE